MLLRLVRLSRFYPTYTASFTDADWQAHSPAVWSEKKAGAIAPAFEYRFSEETTEASS